MDDAVVVEVGYGGEGCSYQICGVRLIITAFPTYSVEEFTAKGEICY